MNRHLLVLALLGACNGPETLVFNSDPGVTITAPVQNATLIAGQDLTLQARAFDLETETADLALVWSDGTGFDFGDPTEIDGEQVSWLVSGGLPAGEHSLTLTAIDADGATAEDSTAFTTVENAPPTVTFFGPGSGLHVSELPIEIDARFGDEDEADLSALTLVWGDDATGSTDAPDHPNSAGEARFSIAGIPAGDRSISVTVIDSAGSEGTGTVHFEVLSADKDGDGFLDPAFGGADCDDDNADVYPGATETCDGLDDDCDGAVDDGATDPQSWYVDADGDGFGDPGAETVTCTPPADHTADNTDCDDDDDDAYPGATELCNGADNDCNGIADDGAETTWYRDADGDSYGDISNSTAACTKPTGFVANDEDCDDTDELIHPAATEVCNEVDDDCDGSLPADELTNNDSDSHVLCDDCDDAVASINPSAAEACNGLDDNCSGSPDDGGVCPCPVQIYDGRPYQFCPSLQTWWDAADACAATNYHLLTINDPAEDVWVNAAINSYAFGYWWMGLNDIDVPNTWAWEDGTPFAHNNWGPTEPNNLLGNEACVELNRFEPATGWNDQPCDFQWKYVCEYGE